MVKAQITLKVDPEIARHIEARREKANFKLSPWFEEEYKKQFMMIGNLQKKLEEVNKKINEQQAEADKIVEQIRELKKVDEILVEKLSDSAKDYLSKVPDLEEKGYDSIALFKRFNNSYGLNIDQEKYNELVIRYSGAKNG